MSYRLFLAIPISEKLKKQTLEIQKKYKDINVRWLFGKNLHITIIPPWYEESLEQVDKTLDDFAALIKDKIKPFNLKFFNVCFGPNKFFPLGTKCPYESKGLASARHPYLIWAEGKKSEELIMLKRELENFLLDRKILQNVENRPFYLHMTLARFRDEDYKKFSIKQINEKISWKEQVSSLVLMQSQLSRSGAEYTVLKEIKL